MFKNFKWFPVTVRLKYKHLRQTSRFPSVLSLLTEFYTSSLTICLQITYRASVSLHMLLPLLDATALIFPRSLLFTFPDPT